MTIPTFSKKWLVPFEKPWLLMATSHSVYEWGRNFLGLTPLRANCWMHCWMSEAAWTEWKSYSRPRYNYVAWLPGSTRLSIFKSATLGTRSLFVCGSQQFEMSSLARKNVQQLSMSRSLTCDALKERLTRTPVSAMRQWKLSDYVFAVSKRSGKTSSPSSRSVSSSRLWSGEHDPIQDFRDWKLRTMEEEGDAL